MVLKEKWEENLDATARETLRAIELAASNESVPMISTKITGLVDLKILHKLHHDEPLSEGEKRGFEHLRERLDEICFSAKNHNVGIFIDAEESWIQRPVDNLALEMMEKYNLENVTVFNTYQMYKTDSLTKLKEHHQLAITKGYNLGLNWSEVPTWTKSAKGLWNWVIPVRFIRIKMQQITLITKVLNIVYRIMRRFLPVVLLIMNTVMLTRPVLCRNMTLILIINTLTFVSCME